MTFRPRHPLPSWEWPVAGFAHVFAFALLVLSQCGSTQAPLFKPQDAIIVSLAGPPAQQSRMPTRAERAPDPTRGAADSAVKPPPNASDLSLPTDPTKGSERADVQRQSLMEELEREQLLKDLDAEVGTTDRMRTGDASSSDGTQSREGLDDPALRRWVRDATALLAKNFHPLPSLCAAHPKAEAIARAPVAKNGAVTGEATVVDTSGNASIDSACVAAFRSTPQLPPLPDRFDGLDADLPCVCP